MILFNVNHLIAHKWFEVLLFNISNLIYQVFHYEQFEHICIVSNN